MIDRIVYINLERSPHRQQAFEAHMSTIEGVPDILERFNAYDGRDYENETAVIDAAIADGLAFYEVFKSPDYEWIGCGTLAAFWSYFKILQRAIERNETTLVLYDDRPIISPFPFWKPQRTLAELQSIVSDLENKPDPFLALQLCWGRDDEILCSPHPGLETNSEIVYGFSGKGDSHNIYSPLGAKWLIDNFIREPHNLEEVTGRISEERDEGSYSTRYVQNGWGHFIEHEIQDRLAIDVSKSNVDIKPNDHPERYEQFRQTQPSEDTSMIEKVLILALEDDKTDIFRFGMAVGSLCTNKVPEERIEFFPASDGRNKETNTVIDEAVADGFIHFDVLKGTDINTAQIGINWSFLRMLRHIHSECQAPVMILLSDCLLLLNFWDLQDIVNKLSFYENKSLGFIQLSRWSSGAEHFIRPTPIEPGSRITREMAYGEHGMIFTQAGAKLFLDYFHTPECIGWTPELLVREIKSDELGIYSLYPEVVAHEYYKKWSDRNFE